MDPSTLSSTEAHRLFGRLYRRERSDEHQQEVDQIVSEVSDIYVRIKRIQELDEEYGLKNRGVETLEDELGATPSPVSAPASAARVPAETIPPRFAPRRKKKSVGLFSRLFGGEILQWGRETGTLTGGFLGLNLHLSPAAEKVLRLPESQVIAVLKGFRVAAAVAWENWEPRRYNAIILAYQFFNEYIKVPNIFRMTEDPVERVNLTIKMQQYYGTLLLYPGYQRILLDDFPNLIIQQENYHNLASDLNLGVQNIVNLEIATPGLRDVILALYVLGRKKIITWDMVAQELQIREPKTDEYRAPESVKKKIAVQIQTLQKNLSDRRSRIEEINNLRKEYFEFDESGRLKINFINAIIKDIVPRMYPRASVDEGLLRMHRDEAHRLLHVLLRDFAITHEQLLVGPVQLQGEGGQPETVMLFRQNIFAKKMEEIDSISREMESFIKKNSNLTYPMADFYRDVKGHTDDFVIEGFLKIVKQALKPIREIASDLSVVLNNHQGAVEAEKSGQLKEFLERTREISIETIDVGKRFIPHAERLLAVNNRFEGRRVVDVVFEIARNFFNYLYIFNDNELALAFAAVPRLKQEVVQITEQLQALGVSPAAGKSGQTESAGAVGEEP